MSVLIKGKKMPKSCLSCPLQGGTADCRLTQKTYNWGLTERPSDCPLIEVPPHGRLIDADELEKKFCSHCDDYMSGKDECKEGCFDLKIIKSMPTIIPADKDGET